MKNILLRYGLLAGLISSIGLFAMAFAGEIDFKNGMLYGYASMLLAFSLIFVAVKNFRDKQNGGVISFIHAFKIGFYITVVASTVYVIVWLINYYYFIPDFSEKMMAHYVSELNASQLSQEVKNAKIEEMKKFSEYYKNPIVNGLVTYTEIMPVGIIVSLITAAFLKKKPQLNHSI